MVHDETPGAGDDEAPVAAGSEVTLSDGETETTGVVEEPGIDRDNVLDELEKFLGLIDSKLASEFFAVVNQYITWFPNLDGLDDFIILYGANQFLHGLCKVLKRNKVDGPRSRQLARVWTIRLFKIDNPAWTPHWLFKPFETE